MSMVSVLEGVWTMGVMRAQLDMHEDTEVNQQSLPSRRSSSSVVDRHIDNSTVINAGMVGSKGISRAQQEAPNCLGGQGSLLGEGDS